MAVIESGSDATLSSFFCIRDSIVEEHRIVDTSLSIGFVHYFFFESLSPVTRSFRPAARCAPVGHREQSCVDRVRTSSWKEVAELRTRSRTSLVSSREHFLPDNRPTHLFVGRIVKLPENVLFQKFSSALDRCHNSVLQTTRLSVCWILYRLDHPTIDSIAGQAKFRVVFQF